MKKILLVSDLDGTLLTRSQQISPVNEKAIQWFREAGGLFTFATGRTEDSVVPFAQQLLLDLPMILYNGAKIYNPLNGETLYEKTLSIPLEFWEKLLQASADGTALLIYENGKVFASHRNKLLEKHEKKDGTVCLPFRNEMIHQPVTKILMIAETVDRLEQLEAGVRDHEIDCEMVYSESNYLEILPPNVSKGTALRKLMRLLQIEELYTIAIGDNLNDISMVLQADLGVAVGNAHPDLKEAADRVIVHHEKHAIAVLIEDIMKKSDPLAN